jgi:hypothetical protein
VGRNGLILVLAVLLLASNAAWFLSDRRLDDSPPREAPPGPAEDAVQVMRALRTRIAELEAKRAPAEPTEPETTPARAPARSSTAESHTAASDWKWAMGLSEIHDPAKRAAAWQEMKSRLTDEERGRVISALRQLSQMRFVEFDKGAWRPLVEGRLGSEDAEVRAAAAAAMAALAESNDQLEPLLSLIDDEDLGVRKAVGEALARGSEGVLTGAVGKAFLRLLADDPRVARAALDASSYLKEVDPAIEARVIRLTREKKENVGTYAREFLSNLKTKSPRVAELMVTELASDDYVVRNYACAGLTSGVPDSHRKRAADAALEKMKELSHWNDHQVLLTVIVANGDSTHVDEIERFAGNPLLPEWHREQLRRYAGKLRRRLMGE